MNFQGEFETHITVALSNPKQWELLWNWCQARDLKCVHIVLERGLRASQPMMTRHGVGTLKAELRKAAALCRECQSAGFQVSRVKLEVAPSNQDVPQTPVQAQSYSGRRYFEHHIKLLLPAEANLSALEAAVKPHGAHLSRNARRVRGDGQQERFVTQRCKSVGRHEANHSFGQLLQTLEDLGFPILETEAEFVVFDSNLALDAGWLDEPAPHYGQPKRRFPQYSARAGIGGQNRTPSRL